MNFRKLLIIHALVTFAAGVVLIVKPAFIPSLVGIQLNFSSYLVCYLLAASELSLAFLSFAGRTLKDPKAIRIIAMSCIVLHVSSALVEVYAVTQGVSDALWANVGLRFIAVVLFFYYGIRKAGRRTDYIGRR